MTAEIFDFARRSKFTREPFEGIAPIASAWRIKGVLPARGVAFVVGQSKAGKSFFAIDTVLRVAAGAPKVLGRRSRPCGIVYVAAEDPNGCRTRIAAWRKKHHRSTPMPFELIGQGLNLLDEGDVTDLKSTLSDAADRFESDGLPLGIVVIDTLSRVIPGVDENSSIDMSRAFVVLDEIQRHTDALVLVVAHFGKGGADKGIRGWSGMDANSDATVTVEREAEEPDLRTVTFAKVKNGVDGGKLSFRLEQVGLGVFDEDGDEVTSCVPIFEAASDSALKPRRAKALNAPEQLVLGSVKFVTDHGQTHPLPETAEGAKPWQKAVTRDDVRARAIEAGLAGEDKPATVRQRFSRALEGLAAARKVRIEGDLLWLL